MSSKSIIAVVLVVAVVAIVAVGAYFLLPGKREVPEPNDTLTAAASDEGKAEDVVEAQFRQDYLNTPATATISVELKDVSDEYWKATAIYGSDSKTYWVPKERAKGLRMQIGQSQTYAISMQMTFLGETTSMDGTYTYTVAETTTYEGFQCYKVEISGSTTVMDMSAQYSGYTYVDTEDYRARYMTITVIMDAMEQTQTMTTEYFFNYDTNKLRMKITMDGQVLTDTETYMPDSTFTQYNMQEFLGGDLYIGWSKDFGFQSDSTKYTMTLTVTKEEIVTVPAGTFRCYVMSATVPEIEEMEGYDMTTNLWVNAQMTLVPKMEVSVSYQGQTVLSMSMTLQSYSGY